MKSLLKITVKILTLLLISQLLSACYNKGEIKSMLQRKYDALNPNGNLAFCYFIGRLDFPYIASPVTIFSPEYNIYNTNELAIRLPAFEKAGLLQSELVMADDGITYPRYSLTDSGLKFLYAIERPGQRQVYHEKNFCFGRRVIESITDVSDREGPDRKETIIKFTYRIENMPDWAVVPELLEIYQPREKFSKDKTIYEGTVGLENRKGELYNSGWGPLIQMKQYEFY